VQPPSEHVHWLFATGVLLLGLLLLAEAIVGREVWRRRKWRAYLFPSLLFGLGVFMWPVMVLFTNSTIHMLAHSSWAQMLMLAGAAELGLVSGKLKNELWKLCVPAMLVVSGAAFLIHEANPWFYSRSAFVHHTCGWILLVGALFPLALAFKPRSWVFASGYALMVVAVSIALYTSRDVAPVFGHLDPAAGVQHR
jgi:4-amino-4-deoxy-L-arabinose transferase-like glycosyltransferase